MIILEIIPVFRYFAREEDRVTKGKKSRARLGIELRKCIAALLLFERHAEKKGISKRNREKTTA